MTTQEETMGAIRRATAAAHRAVGLALKWLASAAFVALMAMLSLNILNRFAHISSFHWLDEIVELCFAAMVFYGAAAVWASGGHFSVGDWISPRLPGPRSRAAYLVIKECAGLAFIAVVLYYSTQLTLRAGESTAVFRIPKFVLYLPMPVSALVMAAYSLVRSVDAIAALCKPGVARAADE